MIKIKIERNPDDLSLCIFIINNHSFSFFFDAFIIYNMCRQLSEEPSPSSESHQAPDKYFMFGEKTQIRQHNNPTNIHIIAHHILMFIYVPTIIKNGCQLKNLHPAPSGRVAAQYPPMKACPNTTASSERYFGVGSGVIFAMLEKR